MKINSISFENFKGLKENTITFNQDLTVIIGGNGVGKSSIIEGVSICLSWIIARIKSAKGIGSYISADDIFNGENSAAVKANFDTIQTLSIPSKTISGLSKTRTTYLDDLNKYSFAIQQKIEQTNFKTSVPVFAFYGVKRAVIVPPLRAKNKDFSLLETYSESLNGAANFKSFFQWFRNQEDIENEHKVRMNTPLLMEQSNEGKAILDPERELNTVRNALAVFLPTYCNIHIRRNPLRMLIEKNGTEYSINQLSDGEKIFIALIGDLCRRLVLANPTMPDPLKGEGIVLIDEIDLHLHPNWQVDIISHLNEVFPNVQFIVTTHSPHVITNTPTVSLRILNNEEAQIKIEESAIGYGLPSLVILKDIMDLKNDQPSIIEEKIKDVYKLLHTGTDKQLNEVYQELVNLSPELPELVRIRKLIERKNR